MSGGPLPAPEVRPRTLVVAGITVRLAGRTILDGFRRGLKAAWLPDQDWESMLAMPVADVRRRLSLDAPPVYPELRSSEIKAAQAAA